MSATAFKNAVKQKVYLERSQPKSRAKFGLLEKRYDHRIRARRAETKKHKLKGLHEQAASRNPDEFYFGMIKHKTEGGIPSLPDPSIAEEDALSTKDLLEMADQDIGYLEMHRQIDQKKLEQLQSRLHFVEDKLAPRQHLIFVDTKKDAKNFDAAEHFRTLPEFLDRTHNRPTIEQLQDPDLLTVAVPEGRRQVAKRPTKSDLKAVEEERALAYDDLAARKRRVDRLEKMTGELVTKKKVTGSQKKNKPRAIQKEDGTVLYKWKRQRSR